jgi:hypothetical protein
MSLTDMKLNTHVIGDLSASGATRTTPYLQVFDFDWTSDWTLTGVANMAWTGTRPVNSNIASQFKFTDLAPVPLPAPVLMLMAALGGLGALRLRKRA